MDRKGSGFSVLVLLLAVVIILLLGVIGWLVWSRIQATFINGIDAESLVLNFYQKYTDGNTDRSTLVSQYGTPALQAEYNQFISSPGEISGFDPLTCVQGIAPTTITSYKSYRTNADVTVSEAFNPPVTLTVSVVNQSGLKIDHVTCPQ